MLLRIIAQRCIPIAGIFADIDAVADKAVNRVFLSYTHWYMLLRREEHNEESLGHLEDSGRLLILSVKAFARVTGPLSEVRYAQQVVISYNYIQLSPVH
jgi:hypothetical protein